jgi:hypothetical protein
MQQQQQQQQFSRRPPEADPSVPCHLSCLLGPAVPALLLLLLLSQGSALNLVQDLPISKPLTASEVNTLSGMVGVPTLCSFYGDIKGLTPRLAAAVDRMKALSSVVHLALCKVGFRVCRGTASHRDQFNGGGWRVLLTRLLSRWLETLASLLTNSRFPYQFLPGCVLCCANIPPGCVLCCAAVW